MKVRFDKDTQLLEVMEANVANLGEEATKNLTLFYAQSDDRIVGFNLFNAVKNKKDLVYLPVRFRAAGLLRLLRFEEGLTQEELSLKAGVSFRTVQRAETGEINITLEMLSRFVNAFPKFDFTLLLESELKVSA